MNLKIRKSLLEGILTKKPLGFMVFSGSILILNNVNKPKYTCYICV